MHRFSALALVAVLCSLQGCSGLSTYVDSEDAALGRVVVYRNGIAYFERRAHVDGDKLVLKVPLDKVDDFLKSLTVADAKTKKPFPVSFPTRGVAGADGNVDMIIQLPRVGTYDLLLSYITEAPAWKPSYRLVVQEDGAVNVQGWAIVDNTSGEDWKSVRLGVGSSSALSFRYDLRSVHNVHREQLRRKQSFAVAPPRGGSVHKNDPAANQPVVLTLADKDIPRPEDHPDVAGDMMKEAEQQQQPMIVAEKTMMESATTGSGSARVARVGRGGGKYWRKSKSRPATRQPRATSRPMPQQGPMAKPSPAPKKPSMYRNDNRVKQLARQLKSGQHTLVIEGYARHGERDATRKSLDRANLLRNRLILEGIAPARLQVKGNGWVQGQTAGVRLVQAAAAPPSGGKKDQQASTDGGDPIGESHFESKSNTTVKRGTSAMVSIMNGQAKGEVVYLYDPAAKRGNSRFAFKAVRFTNPTDSTLESGPVTVYGNNRFIGEGLSNPIPPHSTAFVPFALDRQVVVGQEGSTGDRISKLITLQRGVLTAEVQHLKKTQLTLTNRSALDAKIYVRHSVRKGWKLTKSPKVFETLGDAHLFEVKLAAGKTTVLQLEEATPLTRTVDLRTPTALEMVSVYLRTPNHNKRFEEPMKKLLQIHKEIADFGEEITSTRQRMEDYRERIDELHAQIINLQSVKGGGQRLMRHLKNKMVEISNRLQSSTISVVDLQQKLMMARIRFQDGIAELTLDELASKKTADAVR